MRKMGRGKHWTTEEDKRLLEIVGIISKAGVDKIVAFEQFCKEHRYRTPKSCSRRLERLTVPNEGQELSEPVQESFDLDFGKKVFMITYDVNNDYLFYDVGKFSEFEAIGLLEVVKQKLMKP